MSNSLKEAFLNLASSLGHCQENSRSIVDVLKRGCSDLAENAEGGGGGSLHEYSTTEHIVGKWIDGSDIWEKTIDVTGFSATNGANNCFSGEYNLGDNIPNVSHLWFVNGYYFTGNLYRSFIAGNGSPSDKTIELYANYSRTNVDGIVTIQYIKA